MYMVNISQGCATNKRSPHVAKDSLRWEYSWLRTSKIGIIFLMVVSKEDCSGWCGKSHIQPNPAWLCHWLSVFIQCPSIIDFPATVFVYTIRFSLDIAIRCLI